MSGQPNYDPSVHSSQADVWYLKQIHFGQKQVKVITQNFNGPCSFIAICNILVLRGQIEILPHDRSTVSYEFLSQLVGEYLLTNCPGMDISAALSVLPTTTKGLDLNPQFASVSAFSPHAGELDLFARAGIHLVHGWVVDPESPEVDVMAHVGDYDSAVNLIADADYITRGQLLGRANYDADADGAGPSAGPSAGGDSDTYSDEQRHKIEQAIVAQEFLDATKSQLTYHGLFQLAATLEPGALVALFRNAHLSVVYKSLTSPTADATPDGNPKQDPISTQPSALYALVTDDVFLHEHSIVWERLDDIDGGSTFVDSNFQLAVPMGGDVAGQTVDGLTDAENAADRELARQLQAEEDQRAREVYQRQLERRRVEAEAAREAAVKTQERGWRRPRVKGKKGKQCVVM